MTLKGLFCEVCGASRVTEEHQKLHKLRAGDRVRVWLDTAGGEVRVDATVTDTFEHEEEGPVVMCEFDKILENGEDRTDAYTDKIGRERGFPERDLDQIDMEVIE